MEINLINGKYKGFRNTVMFSADIENRVNNEICKKFNIRSKNLIKIASNVESSYKLPATRFNSNIISTSKIIDFIKDVSTNKVYEIKYLYIFENGEEYYHFYKSNEICMIDEEKNNVLNFTITVARKLLDIYVYRIYKDDEYEYADYFYKVKEV